MKYIAQYGGKRLDLATMERVRLGRLGQSTLLRALVNTAPALPHLPAPRVQVASLPLP